MVHDAIKRRFHGPHLLHQPLPSSDLIVEVAAVLLAQVLVHAFVRGSRLEADPAEMRLAAMALHVVASILHLLHHTFAAGASLRTRLFHPALEIAIRLHNAGLILRACQPMMVLGAAVRTEVDQTVAADTAVLVLLRPVVDLCTVLAQASRKLVRMRFDVILQRLLQDGLQFGLS